MKPCTHIGCDKPGRHSEIGVDGREWAFLCGRHTDELHLALATPQAKWVDVAYNTWVRAAGGEEALWGRMA